MKKILNNPIACLKPWSKSASYYYHETAFLKAHLYFWSHDFSHMTTTENWNCIWLDKSTNVSIWLK